jgi:hypothetical protein
MKNNLYWTGDRYGFLFVEYNKAKENHYKLFSIKNNTILKLLKEKVSNEMLDRKIWKVYND